VWSKAGRFVEGLHAVGDIFTKISVNCVLNYMLHYYLCVYFYGFFLCVHVYVLLLLFMYESVHLHNVFFLFKFYI
jgi:hypothetical protein